MSYIYRIAPLDIVDNIPVFPGCDHVSPQGPQVPGYFVIYGSTPNPRRHITWGVIFKDYLTNKCLVGAEPDILNTIPGCITLQELVFPTPHLWSCWQCDTKKFELGEWVNYWDDIVFTAFTPMVSTISSLAPLALIDKIAIGGKPAAPFALGSFNPVEIATGVTYIGDHHEAQWPEE